ncbi:MAG TPA: hypothetical protein VH575_15320 [Gemmataceae bacterium]|jgi:hypothetical protein
MIFRVSQKLNAKIKAGALRALPLHENPLADWSAHLFVAGRTQYVLLSNTRSLYSTGMLRRYHSGGHCHFVRQPDDEATISLWRQTETGMVGLTALAQLGKLLGADG